MRVVVTVFVICLLMDLPAEADSFRYRVEGSMSVTGNSVCGGPCEQTLSFSFLFTYMALDDLDPSHSPGSGYVARWASEAQVASSGPLMPFGIRSPSSLTTYVPFVNAAGDEFDLGLAVSSYITKTPWIAPAFSAGQLWGCRSATCATAFAEGDPVSGLPLYGPSRVTATRVPEPTTLLLSLVALGCVAARTAARRACR
jgi:hypothetical protein